MTRVNKRAASARPARARSKPPARRSKPYKVVFESVTQEKKKQLTVVTYNTQPPPGFSFVPTGHPRLTQECKDLSSAKGRKVFEVSTSLPRKKNTISRQVHRVGYHFTSSIVGQACENLGLYVGQSGRIRRYDAEVSDRVLGYGIYGNSLRNDTNHPVSATFDVSQEKLNARAIDTIKDLFPKIPEKDIDDIIKRAFQKVWSSAGFSAIRLLTLYKGDNKVGTATELPFPRRVQLAVVAHIRHVYTDYDKLLRTGTWHDARAAVEKVTLDQLVRWRGDEQKGTNDMELILREVIVISDDDTDDEESDDEEILRRDTSVEFISSQAFAHNLQPQIMDHSKDRVNIDNHRAYTTNQDTANLAGQFVRRSKRLEQKRREKADHRGFSRYREALARSKGGHNQGTSSDALGIRSNEDEIFYQRDERGQDIFQSSKGHHMVEPREFAPRFRQGSPVLAVPGGRVLHRSNTHGPEVSSSDLSIHLGQLIEDVKQNQIPTSSQLPSSPNRIPRTQGVINCFPEPRNTRKTHHDSPYQHTAPTQIVFDKPVLQKPTGSNKQFIDTSEGYQYEETTRQPRHRIRESVLPSIEPTVEIDKPRRISDQGAEFYSSMQKPPMDSIIVEQIPSSREGQYTGPHSLQRIVDFDDIESDVRNKRRRLDAIPYSQLPDAVRQSARNNAGRVELVRQYEELPVQYHEPINPTTTQRGLGPYQPGMSTSERREYQTGLAEVPPTHSSSFITYEKAPEDRRRQSLFPSDLGQHMSTSQSSYLPNHGSAVSCNFSAPVRGLHRTGEGSFVSQNSWIRQNRSEPEFPVSSISNKRIATLQRSPLIDKEVHHSYYDPATEGIWQVDSRPEHHQPTFEPLPQRIQSLAHQGPQTPRLNWRREEDVEPHPVQSNDEQRVLYSGELVPNNQQSYVQARSRTDLPLERAYHVVSPMTSRLHQLTHHREAYQDPPIVRRPVYISAPHQHPSSHRSCQEENAALQSSNEVFPILRMQQQSSGTAEEPQ
ncbi:MAG: hypothetical protein M1827_005421 [Pycnora praestabilis]|nr:MAG: hypothetical protein M1827_005421 [Pycnora praestabilis]